jgi:competence protein ComEC
MGGFKNRPAVKFCLPFMLGIVIGRSWPITGPSGTFSLFAAATVALIVVLALRHSLGQQFILYLLILIFGVLKFTFDGNGGSPDSVSRAVRPGRTTVLYASVEGVPDSGNRSFRFVVEAESIGTPRGKLAVSGGVLVSAQRGAIPGPTLDSLTYGRCVRLSGELTLPSGPRNPGDFDQREYLHLNGIDARMFLDAADGIALGPENGTSFTAMLVTPVRRSVGSRLDKLVGGVEANFLKGLITGDRTVVPPDVKTAFINSGVMHILAVSGLHVVIVVMMVMTLLRGLRVPERPRIVATCVLLVYYNFLTGGAASVTRSVIMAIVILAGTMAERRTDTYNSLALSAVIILLVDSKQCFQPGFQLSFAAVFSLIYLYPRLQEAVRLLPASFVKRRWAISCAAALCVSLAAGVGTLPFTSLYFGKISVIGLAANMVIVPLSNIILVSGMLTVGVSYLWGWGGEVFAGVTGVLTQGLLWAVSFFGNLPFAYLSSHFTIWSSLAYYGALGAAIGLIGESTRKRTLLLILAAADLYLAADLIQPPPRDMVRVTFLDVGQGDAAFLEFPGDLRVLVDAGPRSAEWDAGRRFVEPFLRWRGIGMLSGIVLTHPHSDHLGGIPYLLEHFKVRELIDAGSQPGSGLHRQELRIADSMGIPRVIVKAGARIPGPEDARLYVLGPGEGFVMHDSTKHPNLNNESVVLKVVYGKTTLLLAGDAEREEEERMAGAYGRFLRSDVLKAGHHGSITSSTPEFLDLVKPSMAVVSVGARNKFRLPSLEVLERFTERGIRFFRTDESGALVVESDGESWSVVEWR